MDLILELTMPIRKSIQRFFTRKPLLWLTFTLENELWNKDNLSIHFKAINSRRIYFFIKEGIFSISQLNYPSLSINRIDIQYIRPNENPDTNLMDFLKNLSKLFKLSFKDQSVEQ